LRARALRAFRDADGSDLDWAGALMISEAFEDIGFIRSFTEAYAKSMKKRRR